jgi:F-type H+-transporting ATPase subunit gamma
VASLKVIRKRISTVRNTQQVTKAMKMVAAAKLRRAQERAENARAYSDKLTGILTNLAGAIGADVHPFLRPGAEAPAHLILLTSDRGLCGGYNAGLNKLAENFLESEDGRDARITICGRRGNDHFSSRDATIETAHTNLTADMGIELAREVSADVAKRFTEGECGKVYVLYSKFQSAISQEPVVEQLLPIAPPEADENDPGNDYVYEPNAAQILASLLPRYLETKVFHAMLEATASEHGARMTAMDSATRNAGEMIEKLTLQMNRARQAGITTELMEIVGGAEALNG